MSTKRTKNKYTFLQENNGVTRVFWEDIYVADVVLKAGEEVRMSIILPYDLTWDGTPYDLLVDILDKVLVSFAKE